MHVYDWPSLFFLSFFSVLGTIEYHSVISIYKNQLLGRHRTRPSSHKVNQGMISNYYTTPKSFNAVLPFWLRIYQQLHNSWCDLSRPNFSECSLSSVQISRSVVSDSLWPHESQHSRPPCPSPTPGVHSNSCPSSQWCHPAISSSVVPFSSWPQSLPASESFPMSQLFAWGGQSIGVFSFSISQSFQWTPRTDLL